MWWYSRITSTESLSFCMAAFSLCLAKYTAHLPQSRDCLYYISRWMLAPSLLQLQKHTDICAYEFAHCPNLWHQLRLTVIVCAWSWRLCGINSAMPTYRPHRIKTLKISMWIYAAMETSVLYRTDINCKKVFWIIYFNLISCLHIRHF